MYTELTISIIKLQITINSLESTLMMDVVFFRWLDVETRFALSFCYGDEMCYVPAAHGD